MKKLRNTQFGVANSEIQNSNDDKNDVNDLTLNDDVVAMFIDGDLSSTQRNRVLTLISKNHELRRKVSDYVKLKRYENTNKKNISKETTATIVIKEDNTDLCDEIINFDDKTDFYFDNDGIEGFEDDSLSDFDNINLLNEKIASNFDKVPSYLTKKAFSLYSKIVKPMFIKTANNSIFEPVYISLSDDEYEITGIIHNINSTDKSLEIKIIKNGKPYSGEIFLYKGKNLYKRIKKSNQHLFTCNLVNKGNYHIFFKDGEIENNTSLGIEFEIN
jgi:hypothetical protein